jgi:hypothetical protein
MPETHQLDCGGTRSLGCELQVIIIETRNNNEA